MLKNKKKLPMTNFFLKIHSKKPIFPPKFKLKQKIQSKNEQFTQKGVFGPKSALFCHRTAQFFRKSLLQNLENDEKQVRQN
jgi:hypothetical protein